MRSPVLPSYKFVNEKYATEVKSQVSGVILISHKWQSDDLIWPYSDIDYRFVVKNIPINWIDINEKLYNIQYNLIEKYPVCRRLLEHPPGNIYTEGDLFEGYGNAGDISTWNVVYDENHIGPTIINYYRNKGWSRGDDWYYFSLLKKQLMNYSFTQDVNDNQLFDDDKYSQHCLFWHYFAQNWFALYAINQKVRAKGKRDSIINYQSSHYLFDNVISSVDSKYADQIDIQLKFNEIESFMKKQLQKCDVDISTNDQISRNLLMRVISMLRTRPSRYLLYLKPPKNFDTNFLIRREHEEIFFIMKVLNQFASVNSLADDMLPIEKASDIFRNISKSCEAVNNLLDSFYEYQDAFNSICNMNINGE